MFFFVRHSVGRPAPATSLDLKASAFDPKEKLWTKFPSEGSKYTPPHQSVEFKWKDYCPVVFRLEYALFFFINYPKPILRRAPLSVFF